MDRDRKKNVYMDHLLAAEYMCRGTVVSFGTYRCQITKISYSELTVQRQIYPDFCISSPAPVYPGEEKAFSPTVLLEGTNWSLLLRQNSISGVTRVQPCCSLNTVIEKAIWESVYS